MAQFRTNFIRINILSHLNLSSKTLFNNPFCKLKRPYEITNEKTIQYKYQQNKTHIFKKSTYFNKVVGTNFFNKVIIIIIINMD